MVSAKDDDIQIDVLHQLVSNSQAGLPLSHPMPSWASSATAMRMESPRGQSSTALRIIARQVVRSPTQGARSRIRSKRCKIANRCPALPDPRVFASGFPATPGSVKQRPSKRLRVAEQFPVAEHPGSKHDEGGRPLCPEPGGRSCRSFHPVPIFSSPTRRALPRCTRCFFGFVLFSTLI